MTMPTEADVRTTALWRALMEDPAPTDPLAALREASAKRLAILDRDTVFRGCRGLDRATRRLIATRAATPASDPRASTADVDAPSGRARRKARKTATDR